MSGGSHANSVSEGSGQRVLELAYHDKFCGRRRWQKSVGLKSVEGEDRKERVANRSFAGDRGISNEEDADQREALWTE